mmetsp:Transcript_33097/g.69633  ORF Transcript_33097/g.69633 Transcript_33097/m.69633 type:complete len:252 (-) Transcript_33097:1890-2645(-)
MATTSERRECVRRLIGVWPKHDVGREHINCTRAHSSVENTSRCTCCVMLLQPTWPPANGPCTKAEMSQVCNTCATEQHVRTRAFTIVVSDTTAQGEQGGTEIEAEGRTPLERARASSAPFGSAAPALSLARLSRRHVACARSRSSRARRARPARAAPRSRRRRGPSLASKQRGACAASAGARPPGPARSARPRRRSRAGKARSAAPSRTSPAAWSTGPCAWRTCRRQRQWGACAPRHRAEARPPRPPPSVR